jgi:hypothetical protein
VKWSTGTLSVERQQRELLKTRLFRLFGRRIPFGGVDKCYKASQHREYGRLLSSKEKRVARVGCIAPLTHIRSVIMEFDVMSVSSRAGLSGGLSGDRLER